MTTLTSAEGPTEVINARRTESLDAPNIMKLVNAKTERLFGLVNVVQLIEKAVLAVTVHNDKNEVMGHAAFFDYPNVPGVDQADWQGWLNKNYDTEKCSPLNSLFLHYFVAKPAFAKGVAREIVRTVFNAVPDLHFLFLVVPEDAEAEMALSIFQPLEPLGGSDKPDQYSLNVCHRENHCPVLFVRKARVEDHDDLTPIFNRHTDMLKMAYGEFFLAELIEAQDDNNHAIVVEVEGTAVGFMSLCGDVNIDLLSQCFELGPFHNLQKPHPDDVLEPPPESPPPTPAKQEPTEEEEAEALEAEESKGIPNEPESVKGEESLLGKDEPGSKTSEAGLSTIKSPTPKTPVEGEDPEVKVQAKLSEAHMKGSVSSLLSEHEEVLSARSAVSSRKSSAVASAEGDEGTLETAPVLSPTPKPQTPPQQPLFDPVYAGASNAFCVQLFCIDERYEMRAIDFLPKAFELFPDKDFCVATIPHMVPEFPLLQSFVRVTPKCPSTLPQELYVFNKCGLLHSFEVRPACTSDEPEIEKLVHSLHLHGNILGDLKLFNQARRDPHGLMIKAFVATCLDQVVGFALIRQEEDIEHIRSHYNVEDFIYYNHHLRTQHGHLHHFALNPIFQHYSKHFLKELLRLAHFSCLYYPMYPKYASHQLQESHTLVSALNYMVPVKARRQIIYPSEQLGINAPSERISKPTETYALNHINRKLTLEPKVTINAKIVVVGASDVGISFLETLAFCPHLRFNNLTLISPNGLPGELPPDPQRSNFLSTSQCYTQEAMAQIALKTWVNVVSAKMTGVDRAHKFVVVTGGTRVPYDHLVLCTGNQYQISAPTGADPTATNDRLPSDPGRRFLGQVPRNVLTVNDEHDADYVMKWTQKNLLNTDGKVIVYGNTLDAYTAVQSLLTLGVQGSNIQLVEPPLKDQPSCFNNNTVMAAVLSALDEAGVAVHSDYYLAQWNDGNGYPLVQSALFTSDDEPLRLDCALFLCYGNRGVDNESFKAINDSCLVYDGRLVIDGNFHTNDLSIRGAGPLTKFKRKYHADQWSHTNFNSKEVGNMLANAMLRLFDPTIENYLEPPREEYNLIPMYVEAKMKGALLPGNFNYLNIAKPSLNEPLELLMTRLDYGAELITGSTEKDGNPGYFRLHINQYNQLQTITCLSKQPIDTSNLMCLYGTHERYLNNLVSRFNEGLISDFYTYFRESWALALFHDRFNDFKQEVRELLIQRPSSDVSSLEEKIRELIDQDLTIEDKDRKSLLEDFNNTKIKRAVETRLLSFLSYNYYHLPMYAKPGMV